MLDCVGHVVIEVWRTPRDAELPERFRVSLTTQFRICYTCTRRQLQAPSVALQASNKTIYHVVQFAREGPKVLHLRDAER